MKDILDEVASWRDAGKQVAIARVVDIEGSGPRDPGAAMAVNQDGEVIGSVSGGCVEGAVVTGDVKTVNGPIRLVGATVEGDVNNYNGGIVITDNSLVKGSVIVSRPGSGQTLDDDHEPVIVLGPGSEVLGDMTFERPVKLYVHKQARHGAISGADPIAFDGTELPGDG